MGREIGDCRFRAGLGAAMAKRLASSGPKLALVDLDVDIRTMPGDHTDEVTAHLRAALAMCENIDWNVGRILTKLDDLELRENTVVIYFSDNGPNSYRWNGGMKGRKGSIEEGGLHSPFFIRWPSQIRAGVTIPEIAGAIDLLAHFGHGGRLGRLAFRVRGFSLGLGL